MNRYLKIITSLLVVFFVVFYFSYSRENDISLHTPYGVATNFGVGLIPNGTSVPSSCNPWTPFWDSDDDLLYICEDSKTYTLVGGSGGTVLDEDDFASDSALYPPSQQSTANYIATQMATKVNVATFGSTIDSDDFLNDSGTFRLQPEVPHTDANESVTGIWSFTYDRKTCKTTEPAGLAIGDEVCADPTGWDPAGVGGTTKYIFQVTGLGPPIEGKVIRYYNGDVPINTGQISNKVYTYSSNQTLAASQMNSIVVMTGAGVVTLPDGECDTATGKWITVKSSAAQANGLDTTGSSDQFVTSSGVAMTIGYQLNMAGNAGSQVTVQCIQANKWWVVGEIGLCTDNGS